VDAKDQNKSFVPDTPEKDSKDISEPEINVEGQAKAPSNEKNEDDNK